MFAMRDIGSVLSGDESALLRAREAPSGSDVMSIAL